MQKRLCLPLIGLLIASNVHGEFRLKNHGDGIKLGAHQAEAVAVKPVPAPDTAWQFSPGPRKRITFSDIPDWGKEGFSAEVWCMPTAPECGYAMLMRESFGFPKFFSHENYDNYLVSATTGKNLAGRVYCGALLNEYHYFCLTGDQEKVSNYLDGKLMRTDPGMGIPAYQAENTLYIGESIGWAKNNFVGKIALIRIYKTAMDAQKINEHYALLKNNQPLPKYEELIFEKDLREIDDYWSLQKNSTLDFKALKLPTQQSLEIAFAMQFEATQKAELVQIAEFMSLRLDSEGYLHGSFAGVNFKSETALEKERLYKIKLAWNGSYAQMFCDGQALGYAEKVALKSLPQAVNLQIGGNFDGIIGQFSISENKTLPANLGQWTTEKLNNDSIDKFSHPPIRHIVGKPEKDKPLVGFEDLQDWTMSYQAGAVKPIFTRSKEEPLWGEYVLRSEFLQEPHLPSVDSKVILAPPKPLPIHDDFDAINIWRFATSYSRDNRPQLHYTIQYRDSQGQLHDSPFMGGMLEVGWGIHHRPVPPVKAPAEFVSITFSGFNEPRRVTYFDSLRFYVRSQAPIHDAEIPSWQELGLPLSEDTILPTATVPYDKAGIEQNGASTWRIYAEKPGVSLSFDIQPKTGTLDDITAHFNGKTFKPMAGGGAHWAPDRIYPVDLETLLVPGNEAVKATFLKAENQENKLCLHWQYETPLAKELIIRWTFQFKGGSLIIDVEADSEAVGEFRLGAVEGIAGKVVEVPYLNLGSWIRKTYPPGIFAGDGIYISAFLDWYNSDASGLFGESSARPGGRFELNQTTADHRWVPDPTAPDPTNVIRSYSVINGGSYYWPNTEGKRNPLKERIFLTIADRFDDTLPNIPNPTHQYLRDTAEDVWATRMWYVNKLPVMDYFDRELGMWKLCKAYGMEQLNVRLHGNINRQYTPRRCGSPTTFIEDFVEPQIGGNEKCAEFFREMQKLGYRIGHYTDHMLLCQLSYEAWDEDFLNLDSNSNWIYSSGMDKQTKICRLLQLQRKYNAYLRRDFAPNCAYLDQITCPPCWRYTDYDARVPDAAKFSAPYRVFVASLRQEEKDFGPVLSEGITQMYFAGICDSYAQPQRLDIHVLPNFNLRKLHTLSNDCGYHLSLVSRQNSEAAYRLLAYQFAYGNTAHLNGCYHGEPYSKALPPYMIKSYFLIQPLQKFYALEPINEILYHVNGELAPIEKAIAASTIAQNQVKLIYQNNLQAAANLHAEDEFQVTLHGKQYRLPPDGFAVYLPSSCESYSIIQDGRRHDFMWTEKLEYSDGLNKTAAVIGTQAYILRKTEEQLTLIPAPFMQAEKVHLDLEKIPIWANVNQAEIKACDLDGNVIANEKQEIIGRKITVNSDGKAFMFKITR